MSIREVRMTDRVPDIYLAPHPSWVRGHCARCGGALVENTYWHAGRFETRVECWAALLTGTACGEAEAPREAL